MDEFHRAANEDPAYSELLQCVRASFPSDRYALPNAVRPYWKLRDNLYSEDDLVLYGARVVVPAALRRHVLARLHGTAAQRPSSVGHDKWYTGLALTRTSRTSCMLASHARYYNSKNLYDAMTTLPGPSSQCRPTSST